ncbi:hypothetical protein AB1Y20_020681 [Prymnesium parvum]|uniref:Uncharacterized protein n=1 Tax=Prymnesium parvum TaxID=97485 RepID=A0AB34JXL5_PRYPA
MLPRHAAACAACAAAAACLPSSPLPLLLLPRDEPSLLLHSEHADALAAHRLLRHALRRRAPPPGAPPIEVSTDAGGNVVVYMALPPTACAPEVLRSALGAAPPAAPRGGASLREALREAAYEIDGLHHTTSVRARGGGIELRMALRRGEAAPRQGEGKGGRGEGTLGTREGTPHHGEGKVGKGEGAARHGEGKVGIGEGTRRYDEGKRGIGEGPPRHGEGKLGKGEGAPRNGAGKLEQREETRRDGGGERREGEGTTRRDEEGALRLSTARFGAADALAIARAYEAAHAGGGGRSRAAAAARQAEKFGLFEFEHE